MHNANGTNANSECPVIHQLIHLCNVHCSVSMKLTDDEDSCIHVSITLVETVTSKYNQYLTVR